MADRVKLFMELYKMSKIKLSLVQVIYLACKSMSTSQTFISGTEKRVRKGSAQEVRLHAREGFA